jgi:hypothetical protein
MRTLGLGLAVLAAIFGFVAGCGDTDSDEPNGAAGSAGQSVSGAAGSAGAGKGGSASAGGSSAGSASGGSNASGSSGNGAGGGEPGEAGAPSSGGSASLYECNPMKVTCKALPPQCPAFEVPAVEGTCWGACVKIAQCACHEASDCPNNDEYTCWSKQHCGPYVL